MSGTTRWVTGLMLGALVVAAQAREPLDRTLRVFMLGMSQEEAIAAAAKLFGTSVRRHCRAYELERTVCTLTTTRGNQEDPADYFTPKTGSFTLANQELSIFSLQFHRGRLYEISGSWESARGGAAGARKVYLAFAGKYRVEPRVETMRPTLHDNDVFHPIDRKRYSWSDGEVQVELEQELYELVQVSDGQGGHEVEWRGEFTAVDNVVARYLQRELGRATEESRKAFQRESGM